MKFCLFVVVFFLFQSLARPQESIKLPVYFMLGSGDEALEIQFKDSKLRTTDTPESVLYPDKRMALITRVSADQLRIEFEYPLKLSIHSAADHSYVADRVIKSFLASTTVEYADRVMALGGGEFLIFDEIVREHIQDFVKTAETEGYDKFIKQYMGNRNPPRLHQLIGLSFFLPINQVGVAGGIPMNFSVTTRPQLLPWVEFNPPGTNEPRDDLIRLKAVYSAEAPFIVEFHNQIKNLVARTRQLMMRGWLDGLRSKSYFEPSIEEALKEPSDKVIRLEAHLRCKLIFNPQTNFNPLNF